MNLIRRIVCAIVGHRWRVIWDTYIVGDYHEIDFFCHTCKRCRKTNYKHTGPWRIHTTKTSPASPDRDGE